MTKLGIIIILFMSGHIFAQNAKYHATFQLTKFYVDSNRIHWTTTEETGSLPFQIEQHLWGKWTKVGEVMGKGIPDTNSYSMVVNFRNGENLFRIIQWGSESGPRLSHPEKYLATLPEAKYTVEDGKIKFNRVTHYQLTKNETVIKTGCELNIDTSALSKGEYTLKFETKIEKVEIK